MNEINLDYWVRQAKGAQQETERKAFHIIMLAVSKLTGWEFILKGGILLNVVFGSQRHTKDIDFSTSSRFDLDEEKLEELSNELSDSIGVATDELGYDIKCTVQSIKPKYDRLKEREFPTITFGIGYANLNETNVLRQLNKGNSPHKIEIDYSFNELIGDIQLMKFSIDDQIKVYSLSDLIAEKLRAILQQPIRNRYRKQDVYDLYYLSVKDILYKESKEKVLTKLIKTADNRGLQIDRSSFDNSEIKKRLFREFHTLQDSVEEDLPDFEEAFQIVVQYYKSLPWPE